MDRHCRLSLAVALGATCLACQGGGVNGVVKDSNSKPLAGATVTWADKRGTATVVTAQDGIFRVHLAKVGPLSSGAFTVSLAGYQTARESIGDGPYECVVTMQPATAPAPSSVLCRNME
jgi:hypothetical protein